jgi:hypothetical protein
LDEAPQHDFLTAPRPDSAARCLALIAALLALAGCASGPTVSDPTAAITPVAAGHARVYVYRPYNYIGSAGAPPITFDDVPVGEVLLVGAFYCDVLPGKHVISGPWIGTPANIDAASGLLFFLKLSPGFAHFSLDPVEPATGAQEVQSMHLVSMHCPDAVAVPQPAEAAFPKADIDQAMAAGSAAEGRGDLSGAMAVYIKTLQKYPERIDSAPDLVNRAIDLSHKMQPPPALPDYANTHAAVALREVKNANTKSDLSTARLEYQNTLAAAPWWPDAWYNLGMLDDQIAQYKEAKFALQSYLRAKPDAADKTAVQAKIVELTGKISP